MRLRYLPSSRWTSGAARAMRVVIILYSCTLQVLLDGLLVVTGLTADKGSARKLKLNGWSQHTKKKKKREKTRN